ncbi:heavy metal translocating P-type ATPase [Phenylobacterium montanum]|uniref:Cadmium-translocating P-type ATPase n=1 Tax=Phenylobacterium montanum TaxID=2823693 RepID=A0A975FZ60_9CAUL|nr:heavy metal translocating P-type ATPase [Caulobacter sp. S6]QUD87537.1 cadmium-translocating P-type ATPase [Caulobacter sp. S6]
MALTATLSDSAALAADPSVFVRPAGEELQLELLVTGARCAGCLAKIEKGVGALQGVTLARMNLTTGKLAVRWRPGELKPRQIVETLSRLGYPAMPFDPAEAKAQEDVEGRRLALALGVAAFGASNAMMFSVPVWAGLLHQEMGEGVRTLFYWLTAIISAPCALFAGATFFKSAWRSLRAGRANMDVPISIGVLLAIGVSLYETALHGRHAYFDAAVSLLFLLLIGRYLDHKLRASARSAAKDLLALQTVTASRIAQGGAVEATALKDVAAGDRLVVLPGDRMPVDAVIEEGASELDVSLLTGETAPVAAMAGTAVQAGAINLTGRLVVRAIARSEDSAVAAIARLMEAGAQSKSRYVRLADRAAAIYVPTVHSVAALTFVGWMIAGLPLPDAVMRAAAVLIITCPCALGLAVPAVQIVASGRLFRRQVLVKSGAALERLAEIDCVVFDKTGVLTHGRPRLAVADPALVQAAAPLARASRHPLARALAAEAGPGAVADQAHEIAGMGMEGVVEGRRARLGRAAFVGATEAQEAETALWFAFEGEAPRRMDFTDDLRADAGRTIEALKARGLTVQVLSGDVEGAVRRASLGAGVEQYRAGLSPFDKAAAIDALIAAGRRPLMVGDGLNDAAALAKAHVSVAPGAAADASQTAADLVFQGEALWAVVDAIDVARAARRRALENFAFAAAYNLVAAPAAVMGLVTPLIAALAMSGSSLAVTLNALRVNRAGGTGR